jgi:hypothetical protein
MIQHTSSKVELNGHIRKDVGIQVLDFIHEKGKEFNMCKTQAVCNVPHNLYRH